MLQPSVAALYTKVTSLFSTEPPKGSYEATLQRASAMQSNTIRPIVDTQLDGACPLS